MAQNRIRTHRGQHKFRKQTVKQQTQITIKLNEINVSASVWVPNANIPFYSIKCKSFNKQNCVRKFVSNLNVHHLLCSETHIILAWLFVYFMLIFNKTINIVSTHTIINISFCNFFWIVQLLNFSFNPTRATHIHYSRLTWIF